MSRQQAQSKKETQPQTVQLVTGGSGYFGSLLVRKLLQAGKAVRVFDLADAPDRPPQVEFFRGDIRDAPAIEKACEGVSVVHHNVAQVPLAKDRALFHSVNVGGTNNLLQAALKAGCRKVVYMSSSAVYGVPAQNPVTEQMLPAPGEAYGRAKYEGERLCAQMAARGLDVTIIRPRTIMGHGRLGLFQVLFEWVRIGANLPVLGSGDNRYQFVHADDLAQAALLAAEKPGPATFNCGAENFGTMREVLEHLCAHAGTGSRVRNVPMAPAVWAMKITSALGLSPLGDYHALMYGRSMYFDISRAQQELGWRPKYSNNEMFEMGYEWYLRNREAVLASRGASHHRSPLKQGILKVVPWVL